MRKKLLVLSVLCVAMVASMATVARADIKKVEVDYKDGDVTLKGFIAYDEAVEGKRPGVIIIHEWWGHNDYVRGRAEQLARLGYVAFAVDMYGDGKKTEDPKQAGEWAGQFYTDRALAIGRINAALNTLKQNERVDGEKIAAIGYCFGGSMSLEAARAGLDLRGVVSFHGGLKTPAPAKASDLKAKILVLHGADDPLVPNDEVEAFMKEMRDANADYTFVAFGSAVHGFTNPGADARNMPPLKYNAKADLRSWEAMKSFLVEVFQ